MSIGLTREEYEVEQQEWIDAVDNAFRCGYRACYVDVEDYDHELEDMIVLRLLEFVNNGRVDYD